MPKQLESPPRLAEFVLSHLLLGQETYEKLGDFEEGFHSFNKTHGLRTARFWYFGQVLRLIPSISKTCVYWSLTMFNNYFKIALRNIQRHKGYSLINITGLAMGIASCLLILLWVKDELSINRFHEKSDSIYLGMSIEHYGSRISRGPGTVPALGPALRAEYPEVLNAARHENGQGEYLIEYGEKQFKERLQLADPEIFEIFTFPLIQGNVEDLFDDPYVLVLSQDMAEKIFGSEDPIGKILTVNKEEDFRVAGVMKNIPYNSTIRFDIWAPLELTQKWYRPNYTNTWSNMAFRTYFEMAPDLDVEAFNEIIFNRIRQSDAETILEPFIYPFSRMYLDIWGRLAQIRIFSIIGFVILFIACINFMNLSTARSVHRSREVGLRKVVGAHRQQLMRQFFGESMLFTLISLVLACGTAVLLLPVFRSLTGKPLPMSAIWNPAILLGVLAVSAVAGVLSGQLPGSFSFRFPAGDSAQRQQTFREGRQSFPQDFGGNTIHSVCDPHHRNDRDPSAGALYET